MNRDAIDFENGRVSTLFRRILIPTLLGSLAISAVTAIDGIFIGHGVGADGVAAVNIVVPVYTALPRRNVLPERPRRAFRRQS